MTLHDLNEADGVTPGDGLWPDGWEAGHVPGANHAFPGELRDSMDESDRSAAYAPHCASNVPGRWNVWIAADQPTETHSK